MTRDHRRRLGALQDGPTAEGFGVPATSERDRCACPVGGDANRCNNRATQEDLFCDNCRGMHR